MAVNNPLATCVNCGGRTFMFTQLVQTTQVYDAQQDDWKPAEVEFENEFVLSCECDSCGANCEYLFEKETYHDLPSIRESEEDVKQRAAW